MNTRAINFDDIGCSEEDDEGFVFHPNRGRILG
jgi:hypothetical protein